MNEFVWPELYCPFSPQINKYADVLEDYAFEWVLRFNLLRDESVYQRFSKAKFSWLAASTYPDCELEQLKIANDWLSWLFIWDDQWDMSDLGKKPELLKSYYKRFLEIFNGAELTSEDIPLTYALSDIRQRMLSTGSAKLLHRVVCSFEDFFDGCVLEATNRAQGIIPNVETYTNLRRLSVAGDLILLWIELFNPFMIPDILRKHDIVKKLQEMTINILAWCNDIFSAPREMASGDVHNLVLVLHYQQQLPLEQAIKFAAEMHNQEVQKMMNLEVSIPSFGEDVDTQLAKYISGCHAWIRGNLDWSSRSGRYKSTEKLDLAVGMASEIIV
ncbi:Terpene synthase, metal-binding protein [Nostoc sp. NIES-4103]|nr:Terpene synthase, metal-binding protein [Nostoc sp. NIES-4103]